MRIHPTNNTITVSTPDVNHAVAYLKITKVKIADQSCAMAVYATAPNNSVRGIIFNAHSFESDDQIFNELRARNPTVYIVSTQRLGKTRHFVLTIAGHTLPKHVRYHAFTLLIFPFRERVEACFNCRQTGHRTDVCPKSKQHNCRQCGESHPQPTDSKELTCPAQCVICKGGHLTGSRNCKYRFLKKKLPGNDKSTDKATQHLSDSQTEGTTTDIKNCQESFPPLRGRNRCYRTSERGPLPIPIKDPGLPQQTSGRPTCKECCLADGQAATAADTTLRKPTGEGVGRTGQTIATTIVAFFFFFFFRNEQYPETEISSNIAPYASTFSQLSSKREIRTKWVKYQQLRVLTALVSKGN